MKKEEYLFCESCHIELKRQLIGSNVFYYCRACGRITSAKDLITIRIDDNEVKACV